MAAAELAKHPQLGVYQLAAALGAFDDQGLDGAGGASLLQLRVDGRAQVQAELGEVDDPEWPRRLVSAVAAGMAGAAFTARENKLCDRCPVRTCCPLHEDGRQVVAP